MQAPPGQSLASRPVASLTAVAVTGRLVRRQASGSATGLQSRNTYVPCARGVGAPESSTRGSVMGELSRTGGMLDCGTLEEGAPVTWETPAVLGDIRERGDPGDRTPVRRTLVSARVAQKKSAHTEVGAAREDRSRE